MVHRAATPEEAVGKMETLLGPQKRPEPPRVIAGFAGRYAFLSNFFKRALVVEGDSWPSSEHFYQAQKTDDKQGREEIRNVEECDEAKTLGGELEKKGVQRADWHDVKYGVMVQVLRMKFTQHEDLKRKLLETENALLVEANDWGDNVWGVCICKTLATHEPSERKYKPAKHEACTGTGQNLLGKALMQVREEMAFGQRSHL
jgi:hypothetical protein